MKHAQRRLWGTVLACALGLAAGAGTLGACTGIDTGPLFATGGSGGGGDAAADAPELVDAPIDAPEGDAPTDAPELMDAPTDAPELVDAPTDAPELADAPTDAPELADAPTDAPEDAPADAAPPCAHSPCVVGVALDPNCMKCVGQLCMSFPGYCTPGHQWDEGAVMLAAQYCGCP
jgi:hypothetical protein